ncbi:hypothetical protein K4749_40570 [Streptomyces sp. TRM72054]|nr:hypothetical protein [Streptomyces sp. TRM72054]
MRTSLQVGQVRRASIFFFVDEGNGRIFLAAAGSYSATSPNFRVRMYARGC